MKKNPNNGNFVKKVHKNMQLLPKDCGNKPFSSKICLFHQKTNKTLSKGREFHQKIVKKPANLIKVLQKNLQVLLKDSENTRLPSKDLEKT